MTNAEKYGQKYDAETRKKIEQTIRQEWNRVHEQVETADQFVDHMHRVLSMQGFKSASGAELSERSVRYQIFRQGIRFRSRPKNVIVRPFKPRPVVQAPPKLVEPMKAVSRGSTMPKVLEAILTDESLTSEQRLNLVKAYFGV